jgi:hypothetical protein
VLTAREIVRSTYGAWRLAHGDPGGMAYFDATEEGFWRSFRVAILLLPLQVLAVWLQIDFASAEGHWMRILAVDLIAYAIGWMAFPLAAHYLAMALDRERDYVGYIVAYNWSAVLQVGLLLPIAVIDALELLPAPTGDVLGYAAAIALLVYAWFIAKTALNTGGLPAAGFVAMDVMISVLIFSIKHTML